MPNGHVEVYGYVFWVNQCIIGFHGVNEPGGVRVAREDDHEVTEGREDVREAFQQRGSRAKRKLSRGGRNQMGNEPVLALPEGADNFVVYYDARRKGLEACLEKGEGDCLPLFGRDVRTLAIEEANTTKYSIHPGADTMLCSFRLSNRWLSMKKDIASCSSGDYHSSMDVLHLKHGMERNVVLMPQVVKSWDEILLRWGYCDNHDLSTLDNQSIEHDRLIGIKFVLNFVKFISFTFGDKKMISVIEVVSR
ncbi:hypothetical protein Tco_1216457 [Tanacetum coccineum]